MGRIGIGELLLILVIILIFFGPARLPEIGAAIGRALKEFKKAASDIEHDIKEPPKDEKK